MANKITYNIGFNVDSSGLKQVQTELQKIQSMTLDELKIIDPSKTQRDFNEIQQAASHLSAALEKSLNPKLGTINVDKFNQTLKSTGSTLSSVELSFAKAGSAGTMAFRDMTAQLLTTKREVKQTSNLVESMAKTFGNTIRWSVASGALNTITGSIQQAWGYTKRLDSSLNDIRIVTGKSADEMERFAKEANKAAKGLGASTTAYTNASLIYYQQGLGEQDVQARTDVTLKAANVTGQSAAEVSQQLTAVWNGYKVVAEEAELYVDKLAAVAATTAADLEELSDGMSKVASAANTMGVDIDQLSAQLATIVSVTRQDASLVGTALKTIYARMGDLKVSGVDEFGTSLGDVSGQMRQMGIEVLDQEGNLRNMGEVIEEVAAKWGTWTDAQQQAAAVAIAGKRQYNNLIALFENWDMYESALGTSQTSAGTLQKQQDIYMDSLEGHLNQLATAGEKVFDAFMDSESMKDFLDIITKIIDKFGGLVEALGGGGNMLLLLGSIATKVFSGELAKGTTRILSNLNLMKQATIQNEAELEIQAQYANASDEAIKEMVAIKEKALKMDKLLTEEQKLQLENEIKNTAEIYNQIEAEKNRIKEAEEYYSKYGPDEELTGKKAGEALEKQAQDLEQWTTGLSSDISTGKVIKAEQALNIARLSNRSSQEIEADFETSGSLTRGISEERIQELIEAAQLLQEAKQSLVATIDETKEFVSPEELKELETIQEKVLSGELDLSKARTDTEKILKTSIKTQKGYAEQLKKEDKVLHELEQTHENVKKVRQDLFKKIDTTAAIKSVVDLTGSVTGLINGFQFLGNIKNIISDDTLSDWEKFNQSLTAGLSGLLMLITNAKSAGSAISALSVALLGEASILGTLQTLQTAKSLADKQAIIDTWAKTAATAGFVVTEDMSTAAILRTMVAQKIKSVVDKSTLLSTIAQTLANWGLNASMAPLLAITLLIVAAMAALALIVWGVVAAVQAFQKANDNGRENLENMQKAAESATEKLQSLKDEFIELKKELEDIENARNALDELITGTEDWNNAVLSLNQSIIDLMTKYPELVQYVSRGASGVLEISKEGQENLVANQEQLIAQQQSSVFATQAGRMKAVNQVKTEDFADAVLRDDQRKKAAIVATNATVAGAVLGNIIPVIGSLLGAAIGAGMGAVSSIAITNDDTRNEIVAEAFKVIDQYGESILYNPEEFKQILFDAGIKESNEYLIDALLEDKDALLENARIVNANTKAIQMQEQLATQQYFEATDNIAYAQANDKEKRAIERIAAIQASSNSEVYKEVEENMLKQLGKGNANKRKKAAKQYAEAMGWENYTSVEVDKKTGEAIFKFADGSEKRATKTEMASTVASQMALQKVDVSNITNSLNTIATKLNTQKDSNSYNALLTLTGGEVGDFSALSQAEKQNLYNTIATQSAEGLNQTAQNLGYKDGQAYIDAFNQALVNYDNELLKITTNLSTKGLTSIWNNLSDVIQDFSLASQKALANGLSAAYKIAGQEGAQQLADLIKANNLTEAQVTSLLAIYNSIDWYQGTALNEFQIALEEANIVVNESSVVWNNFATSMKNAVNWMQNILLNLDSLTNNLGTLSKIVKDLSVGDIISDEDYQQLVQWNKEFEKYFVQTPDGWMAISTGENFQNTVTETSSNILDPTKIHDAYNQAEYLFNQLIGGYGKDYFNRDQDGNITGIAEDKRQDFRNSLNWDLNNELLSAIGISPTEYHDALWNARYGKIEGIQNEKYDTNAEILMSGLDATGLAAAIYGSTDAASVEKAATLLSNATTEVNKADAFIEETESKVLEFIQNKNPNKFAELESAAKIQAVGNLASNYSDLKNYKTIFTSEQDIEEYNKLARGLLAQEAAKLGIYFSEAFLQDADNFDTVAAAMENARKLELDYFKDIEDELNKLDQSAEKAFGQDKLTKLNQISDTLEKSVAQAKENAGWAQDILKTSIAANDKEGFFNADGTFKDGMSREDINNALAKAQAEGDTETVNRLTELLRAYDAKQDADQAIIDKSWELVDAQIEAFEYGQNMVREFRKFEKEWTQNINKLNNTNFDGLATFVKDFSREFKTSFEDLSSDAEKWELDWQKETKDLTQLQDFAEGGKIVNGQKNPFWNVEQGAIDAAKAQEAINKQLDVMNNMYKDRYEEAKALYDLIISAGEEINALYDEQIDKLNNANDLLASSIDLYKLVGKGMRGSADDIKAYSELISVNAMEAVNYAQAELLAQKRLYQEAVEKGDQTAIEAYAQSQADAAAKYADTLQNAFNTAVEQFGVQLEAAIDEAIGEGGLQAFSDAWELEKTYDDAYLDSVNAEYAMYEFDRNVSKSIDETENIVAQNKLIEMRQRQEARLNAIIAERGRLSQHEIDLANAEYELTLKQIALEEAQQTANTMKLTRDAFGNYSYQYVADENKIADAEAEVKAAESELYNLRKEHEKELIDNFGTYLTDYQTQRGEAVAAGNDALVEALDEKYLGKNGLLTNLQSEVLSLGDGTGLFVGQLDTIANMNFDNLKANIDSLTNNTKAKLEEITNVINNSIGSNDFLNAATTLTSSTTDLNDLAGKAETIINTFSSSVDILNGVVGKLGIAASSLTEKAEIAIDKYAGQVGENKADNNSDTKNTDTTLADDNSTDTTDNSDSEETKETTLIGDINVSNFINAISDKVADYFNTMSELLQNNDMTKALRSTTDALEDNTEAIKTLTEELKEDSAASPVIISNGGSSHAPSLNQLANSNISQTYK